MHDVTCAWEKALVVLYNWNSTVSLDSLRHQRFCEKVASSMYHVHPRALPSTTGTAMYRSIRVYLEVQEWKGSAGGLRPKEWGVAAMWDGVCTATDTHSPCSRKSAPSDQVKLHGWLQHPTMHVPEAQHWVLSHLWKLQGSGCTNTLQTPTCGDDGDDDIAYL